MFSTYRLADALPGEKVINVIHRDAFIALKRVLFFIFLLIIPIVIILMINNLFPSIMEIVWVWPLLLICSSSYLLFVWLLFFFSLIDYFLDVWIITNTRIVDVRQNGLFSRSVSEVRLDKIQDISSNISGFFETFLKFGNVMVQTASEKNAISFEQVANPDKIRDLLVRLTAEEHNKFKHPPQ